MKVTRGQFKQLIREQVRLQIVMQLEEGFKWDMFKGAMGSAASKVKDLYKNIKDAGRAKAVEALATKFSEQVQKLYSQMTQEMARQDLQPDERVIANKAISAQLITIGQALGTKFPSQYQGSTPPPLPGSDSKTDKTGVIKKSVRLKTKADVASTPVQEVVKGKWSCANCNHQGSGEAVYCPRCGQPNLREV